MKIAYLVERLDPSLGGAERYSWDFTRALAAAGHEVCAFAREGAAPDGVALRRVSGASRDFGALVEDALSRETFDVVHGIGWTWSQDVFQPHGGVHLANREARGASKLLDAINPRQRRYRRLERVQYHQRPPRLFVAISDKVRRDMRRFYDVPAERIRTIYNGVDTERFHPRNREQFRAEVRARHGIGADEVVILTVAHNFALKGVPELVAAVTAPDFPACRLVVVGKGRPIAAPAGRVIFAGVVDDTAPWYAAADVFALATYYDPCSLTVLEALSAGIPVVTTTANGAGELLVGGRAGVVTPPGDARALDAALRSLLDPARRREMGLAARALAEEHAIAHNVRSMTAIYDEIIALKGRS